MDQNPPMTVLLLASLFPETSALIFAAAKNETVGWVFNFTVSRVDERRSKSTTILRRVAAEIVLW